MIGLRQISRRPRIAFTLIEVLIAIAIILALMGTMYGFLFGILSSRQGVLEHVRQQTAAAALIKQLDADLPACIVGDSVLGSGIRGDAHQLRVLYRGVAANLAIRGADDPDAFGDLQFTEYRFDAESQRIQARRGPVRASDHDLPPFTPIAGTIHNVRFRYYDGQNWQNRFDSLASNRLPVAIEVAIWSGPAGEPANSPQTAATQPDRSANDALNQAISPEPPQPEEVSQASAIGVDAAAMGAADRLRVFLIPDAAGSTASTTSGGRK